MDRRKTLGALSPGSLNTRASLAPGRYPKDGSKQAGWAGKVPLDKGMARLSLAGPVQRRSSAYITAKGSGLKSDPRPISDKQFQASCARTIITYLATHNYEYQINPKVRQCMLAGIDLVFVAMKNSGRRKQRTARNMRCGVLL